MRVFLLSLLLSVPTAWSANYEFDIDSRVVAVGDIHGAYTEVTGLLREVEVIDADNNWVGGTTHLISLGDLVDRGPGSREVVELLMKLQRQARAAGGEVHVVLGNHEIMVMSGDTRYVTRPEFAAFAADETEAERQALLASFRESNAQMAEEELLAEFDKRYPPGYVALQKAYAPNGELGKWLMELPLAIRVNDSLYVHAGVSNAIAEMSLQEINEDYMAQFAEYQRLIESLRTEGILPRHVGFWDRRLYLNTKAQAMIDAGLKKRPDWFDEFAAMAELEGQFLFGPDSPIWYRGTAFCHPYAESFNTERLLKRVGAKQLVIGHTPAPSGVYSRMDGTVIRLDTGMSPAYKGRPAALIQENGEQWIYYADDGSVAQAIALTRSLSRSLWGQTDEELESLLGGGEIVKIEDIGTGVTKPKKLTLRNGDSTMAAVFKYEDTAPGLEDRERFIKRRHNDADRYQYDPAAYRLDRMIDLQMVPVSVIREVEGEEGNVGAWINNAINERDRLEQEVAFGGHCAQDEQYRLRFIYDVLIYNEDRNLTNILWTKKDWQLRFIDHSLAFRIDERRPKQYRKIDLRVSDLTAKRLEALTLEDLNRELSPWLHPQQIEAIIARRDLILKEALRTDP